MLKSKKYNCNINPSNFASQQLVGNDFRSLVIKYYLFNLFNNCNNKLTKFLSNKFNNLEIMFAY